jgi:homoserine O-succinyltransferase
MPVRLDTDRNPRLAGYPGNEPVHAAGAPCLHIGLMNNMPDGAFRATERQFLTLLGAAAKDVVVRASLYAFPDVPRTEATERHIARYYSSIESLLDGHLDGLIVTGAEPRKSLLKDEPYWGSLTKVIEWAEHNTHSTVWSCLAAHAAVLHVDGIHRRRLADKRFGVFQCAPVSDHPLAAGVPSLFLIPHSRWNDLAERDLTDCGYQVLSRAKDGNIDAFTRRRKSLSVFFQGHPEYDADTLLLEYRRDVGRYLRRERENYPSAPEGYFDRNTADCLAVIRERAFSHPCEELLADLSSVRPAAGIANAWHPVASGLYMNWLAYISEQKVRSLRERPRWGRLTPTEADLTLSLPDSKRKQTVQR